MQLDELLSSSVSQCNFVLAKIMEDIFTMVSVWQDSYILSVNVVTLLIANFSQLTAGFHHAIISFAALAYSRRSCLLKFSQCSVLFELNTRKNLPYKCIGYTCMLQTNSPLILVGPDRASEPLSLLYSQKCWINSKPFKLWPPNFETFPKNYLGTFKFVVMCTSKLRLTLEPSL